MSLQTVYDTLNTASSLVVIALTFSHVSGVQKNLFFFED